jgi:hypothetical protein
MDKNGTNEENDMPSCSDYSYEYRCTKVKIAIAYIKNKYPNLSDKSSGFARALSRRLNRR